jgi:hypothetical protein
MNDEEKCKTCAYKDCIDECLIESDFEIKFKEDIIIKCSGYTKEI